MSVGRGAEFWIVSATLGAIALPGCLAAQEAPKDKGVTLDEITISSSKRDLSIGSLLSGVTIIDDQTLDDARISETADLEELVPSLKTNTRSSRAYTNFTIRGIGSADFYNPAVAVYVDGVPQDASNLDQMLTDAESVEVLKGPQGTLYGRNALAGVINITTKQPDGETRADVQATAATLKPDAQAVISGPVIDNTVFASATVRLASDRGEADNLVTNEEDDDSSNNKYFRGNVRYAPTDGPFEAALSYSYDYLEAEELFFDEEGADDRESAVPFTDEIERDVYTGALTLNGGLGDFAVTSTISFQLLNLNRTVSVPVDERQNSYTEELRGVYEPDNAPISGLLGVFLQKAEFERDAISFFTGNPYDAYVDTESYAVFGESSYDITEALSATLGLRYAYDKAELDFDEINGLSFEEDDYWSAFLPKAGLSYRATDDVSFYATVSQGYKPGGFNRTATNTAAEIPYDNEFSTSYEAGVRADVLGGSLPLQASVYYTEIEDIQLFTGELGQQVIRNLGDARSYGLEVEASTFVADNLEVSGGFHINDAEFKNGTEANGNDLGGNKLPFAPEYALTLGAQYYWEPKSVEGVVIPRLSVSYYGETFFLAYPFDSHSY